MTTSARVCEAMPMPAQFTFADLFAGIGGFHAALTALGGKCTYAVEIDDAAAKVYERNWHMNPLGDITKHTNDVTAHIPPVDVLCAGFPCQPFSKSGAQRGMDEARGTLFFHIMEVVRAHHPQVLILENVRNLAGPRHRHEWDVIIKQLRAEHYRVADTPAILSPHQLPPERGGRPQVRERVFITATYDPTGVLPNHPEPVFTSKQVIDSFDPHTWNIADILLDDDHVGGCELSRDEISWIDAWDNWVASYRSLNPGVRLPGFPIWVDHWRTEDDLRDMINAGQCDDVPAWKMNFLKKNAALFTANEEMCRSWMAAHDVNSFPPSRRKLEWQAGLTPSLWDALIQLRPSGVRVKPPTYVPALVAITQTSIVGPKRRRLAPRETARLQGLPDWFDFGPQGSPATYKQLGNGVNIGAVWNVIIEHCRRDEAILATTESGRAILACIEDAPPSPDQRLLPH
ncbi:DNA (cytosine-5-)-methyltransferase [Actinomyces vulturis]|uniref:DNA (cytosine-5-)-methyltransferase n=1 Tax=Actinomyces vulturis TaxID=1857645 RepID=UPI000AB7CD4C|nr:DNA (cytosine-5-)-methyltransferase [Actinomyces vulturis]